MKVVRVYAPDEERQLQALMLLLRSASPSQDLASGTVGQVPGPSMGFEAENSREPPPQPVDQAPSGMT